MSNKLTLEALMAVQEPAHMSISSDGKYVVYGLESIHCRTKEHHTASIWIAELGKESSAKRMTQGESNDSMPSFSPSGKYISFLSDRAQPGKSKALYVMPVDGGEAYSLTGPKNEKGVGTYEWHPQKDFIAFISPEEKSEKRKKDQEEKNDANVYGQFWDKNKLRLVDIHTKEIKTYDTGSEHVTRFAWNPDGEEIVVGTIPLPRIDDEMSVGMGVNILKIHNEKMEETSIRVKITTQLTWSNQGIILIAAYDGESSASCRALWNIGKQDDRYVLSRIGHGDSDTAEEARTCSLRTVVKSEKGLVSELRRLNDTSLLYSGKHDLRQWDAHFTGETCSVVFTKSSTDTPGEIYSIVEGKIRQLTQHNTNVSKLGIGKTVVCEYESENNIPIDGWYSVPADLQSSFDKRKPLPTVLVVHGGPNMRSSDSFGYVDLFLTAWLVANGYLVLHPNYRGGAAHGDKYAQAVRNHPEVAFEDVIWLLKKEIENGHIDKDRVAITGWSYGGYLSFLAATRESDFHFAASLPGAGISDWGMMACTSDIPKWCGDLGGHVPWNGMGDIVNRDRTGDPLYHVKNVQTPVLIFHGETDERVPVSQSKAFHLAMLDLGKACDLVTYPREGHGFPVPLEKRHYMDFLERSLAFIKKHIGEPSS